MINQNNQILYKTNKISTIELLLLAIVLSIFILPAAQQMVKFYIILAIGVFFVGFYTITSGEQYGVKILLGATALAVLFFLLGDASDIIEIISKLYYYFSTCFPAILFFWFLPRSIEKQRKIIMLLAIILYLFVLSNTYQELLINENATRSFEEALEQGADNVGTYDFTYASGALVPFLGIYFTEQQKKSQNLYSKI